MNSIYIKILSCSGVTALCTAIVLIYISLRYKLFAPIKVKEMSLGSGTLLFVPYQGDYTKMNSAIKKMKAEISKVFGTNIKFFGIYYDNPCTIVDRSYSRAILGAVFDDSTDLSSFLSSHKDYKTTTFQKLKGFGAEFPLFSFLNILSAVIRGYPQLGKYTEANKLEDKISCSMEFYDYPNKTLIIAFPYYKGNETILDQSGYPTPEHKPIDSKKND